MVALLQELRCGGARRRKQDCRLYVAVGLYTLQFTMESGSPSLISLMVFVAVEHYVYLLIGVGIGFDY